MMKLKHVDKRSGGRKRFRRRYPKAVLKVLGEKFFQVPMKARYGVALIAEHETLLSEYDKIVSKAKLKAAGQGNFSPLEHRREATDEAERLVASITGQLTDAEKRDLLADDLQRRGSDPVLIRGILDPNNRQPENNKTSSHHAGCEEDVSHRMHGGGSRVQSEEPAGPCLQAN